MAPSLGKPLRIGTAEASRRPLQTLPCRSDQSRPSSFSVTLAHGSAFPEVIDGAVARPYARPPFMQRRRDANTSSSARTSTDQVYFAHIVDHLYRR